MTRPDRSQKKRDKLGMDAGTASNRLKKAIMFDMACKLRLNICYHCQVEITNVDLFSVEHKIPWLNSETPKELFFDLNNIAFSHLFCNIEAARVPSMYADKKEIAKERYDRLKANPEKYEAHLARKRAAWLKGGGYK